MSEADFLKLAFTIIGALLSVGGFLWWRHIESRFDSLWDTLGRDSQSGTRKKAHDADATSKWNDSMLKDLKRRVERLENGRDQR